MEESEREKRGPERKKKRDMACFRDKGLKRRSH